ncbi:putative ferredoxin-like protein [Desulfofundulus luciae]|uniref:Ferredoxin-like protein n=1 Tax=Desulfofundulus luciae TaxID=74702 RepID=A0ABU0B3M1_9FIRM|nr:DUF2148 domain-containing protein [Desulfofundulus luciae]MDQ0287323.1 putative ferredoxin-like protein [Desulfofundulus luciae]
MPRIYLKEFPEYSPQDLARKDVVVEAAKLMAAAAITSPRGGGIDQVEVEIVYGEEEQEVLARKVEELGRMRKAKIWRNRLFSEAVMVREADAVLLIGNYRAAEYPLDSGCGLCTGKPSCYDLYAKRVTKAGALIDLVDEEPDPNKLVNGPLCGFKVLDHGHAVGSALLMARRLFIDAMPLFSVSVAAQKLGYCPKSQFVVGILLAARNKNPFVDILPDYHVLNLERVYSTLRKQYILARMVYWYDQRSWYPPEKSGQGALEPEQE